MAMPATPSAMATPANLSATATPAKHTLKLFRDFVEKHKFANLPIEKFCEVVQKHTAQDPQTEEEIWEMRRRLVAAHDKYHKLAQGAEVLSHQLEQEVNSKISELQSEVNTLKAENERLKSGSGGQQAGTMAMTNDQYQDLANTRAASTTGLAATQPTQPTSSATTTSNTTNIQARTPTGHPSAGAPRATSQSPSTRSAFGLRNASASGLRDRSPPPPEGSSTIANVMRKQRGADKAPMRPVVPSNDFTPSVVAIPTFLRGAPGSPNLNIFGRAEDVNAFQSMIREYPSLGTAQQANIFHAIADALSFFDPDNPITADVVEDVASNVEEFDQSAQEWASSLENDTERNDFYNSLTSSDWNTSRAVLLMYLVGLRLGRPYRLGLVTAPEGDDQALFDFQVTLHFPLLAHAAQVDRAIPVWLFCESNAWSSLVPDQQSDRDKRPATATPSALIATLAQSGDTRAQRAKRTKSMGQKLKDNVKDGIDNVKRKASGRVQVPDQDYKDLTMMNHPIYGHGYRVHVGKNPEDVQSEKYLNRSMVKGLTEKVEGRNLCKKDNEDGLHKCMQSYASKSAPGFDLDEARQKIDKSLGRCRTCIEEGNSTRMCGILYEDNGEDYLFIKGSPWHRDDDKE